MKRLKYNEETQILLEELAENELHYWRYQDSKFNGNIPIGHTSHERMFTGESPEHIEEGVSCYNNPLQLFKYTLDEVLDEEKTDVIIFCGRNMGTGLYDEDIVKVTEESDLLYVISLKDFYKFCSKADMYFFGDENLKEYYEETIEN